MEKTKVMKDEPAAPPADGGAAARRSRRQAKQAAEQTALPAPKKRRTKDGDGASPSKKQKKGDAKDDAASKPEPIDVKKLLADLSVDYAKKAPVRAPPKLGEKQDWGKAKDGSVIKDITKAPKGWNSNEPDLLPE
jgi:hypothetical protein